MIDTDHSAGWTVGPMIAALIAASALLPAALAAGPLDDGVPDPEPECIPHPPIHIMDDAQFRAPGSGVVNPTAEGTEEDPFVIEGWCIHNPQTERLQWRTSAIRIHGTESHVVIRDNIVTPAPLRSPAAIIPAPNDDAVHCKGADNVTIQGNEIDGNRDLWVFKAGVFSERCDGIVIRDNAIRGFDDRGVFLRDSRDATIEGNIVERNGWGIYLTDTSNGGGSDGAVLRNNTISGNGLAVVSSPAWSPLHDLTIRDNTVTGNLFRGLWIQRSHGVDVVDNTISDNFRGVQLSGASEVTLAGNNVEGNADYGLSTVRLDDLVDARDNWWGHRTGPSGGVEDACTGTVARGFGDEIRGDDVCFDPWLEAPNPDAGAT